MAESQTVIQREAPEIEAYKLGLMEQAKALAGAPPTAEMLANLTPKQLGLAGLQQDAIDTASADIADGGGIGDYEQYLTKAGNFESKNILTQKMSLEALANKFGVTPSEAAESIQDSKSILMEERDTRIRPGLDDKVLTSWNALMITGYLDAYFALQNEVYLDKAIAAGKFLVSNQIQKDGNILRNYKNGKSTINGFLDDYSFTILAFIRLYEATFDESWLYKAKDLKEYVLAHFSDESTQMFFYTSNLDKQLIARKMELSDNVIPASNSSMAHALFLLGQYFYNEEDLSRAKQMLGNSEANMKQYANFYSNWLRLYLLMGEKHFEVAVVG